MTRTFETDAPFRAWDDDHTSLVHVLWAAKHDGLTLADDADKIASMILRSRWLAATKHRASGQPMLCENGLPDGHSHVSGGHNPDGRYTRCLLPEESADWQRRKEALRKRYVAAEEARVAAEAAAKDAHDAFYAVFDADDAPNQPTAKA